MSREVREGGGEEGGKEEGREEKKEKVGEKERRWVGGRIYNVHVHVAC